MTPFLQSATAITTLLLLQLFHIPTITASSSAYIRDEDGKPMLNGGTYYILPQTTANGGGLTAAAQKSEDSPCPLFMTQEKDGSSNGQPFKITSPINSKYLPFGPTEFYLADATTTCTEPLAWRLITDNATGHVYVAAGTTGSPGPTAFSVVMPFNYVQPWNYEINYCDEVVCGPAGIYEKNGLLGIDNDIRFAVRFRKASTETSLFM